MGPIYSYMCLKVENLSQLQKTKEISYKRELTCYCWLWRWRGAMSQGMRVTPRGWKRARKCFLPQWRMQPCWWHHLDLDHVTWPQDGCHRAKRHTLNPWTQRQETREGSKGILLPVCLFPFATQGKLLPRNSLAVFPLHFLGQSLVLWPSQAARGLAFPDSAVVWEGKEKRVGNSFK